MKTIQDLKSKFDALLTPEKEQYLQDHYLQSLFIAQEPHIYQHKQRAQRWSAISQGYEKRFAQWTRIREQLSDLEVLSEFLSTGELSHEEWEKKYDFARETIELEVGYLQGNLKENLKNCIFELSAGDSSYYPHLSDLIRPVITFLESRGFVFSVLLNEAYGYGYFPTRKIILWIQSPFAFG